MNRHMPGGVGSVPGELDRRILGLLSREPLLGHAEMGRRLGMSDRTVARRVQGLMQRKLLSFELITHARTPGTSYSLLALEVYPARAEELARSLAGHPGTGWVRLNRARTRLTLGVPAVGGEGAALVSSLASDPRCKSLLVHHILQEWWPEGGVRTAAAAHREVDDVDCRVIEAMREDPRVEAATLARTLHLDASTVSRRRRRLLEDGVIAVRALQPVRGEEHSSSSTAMVWLAVRPGSWDRVARALVAGGGAYMAFAVSDFEGLYVLMTAPSEAELVAAIDAECADEAVISARVELLGQVFKEEPERW